MQTFDEILQDTAEEFLNDDFAPEIVTFLKELKAVNLMAIATIGVLLGTPAAMATIGTLGLGATESRSIEAIVNRHGVTGLDAMPEGKSPRITITVRNDSVYGITPDELDLGTGKVSLPVRLGEAAQERKLSKLLSQDAGMITLELR